MQKSAAHRDNGRVGQQLLQAGAARWRGPMAALVAAQSCPARPSGRARSSGVPGTPWR